MFFCVRKKSNVIQHFPFYSEIDENEKFNACMSVIKASFLVEQSLNRFDFLEQTQFVNVFRRNKQNIGSVSILKWLE